MLRRAFEPFFTTKPAGKGSGLGLAAVYGTVQTHGGQIDVQSTLGEGTQFRIFLPVSSEVVSEATPEKAVPTPPGQRILVVDDEAMIRDSVKLLLESEGFVVTTAADGPTAIELVRTALHPYDCAVLDMTMPLMTGAEVARALASLDPSLPIIIASGFDLLGTSGMVQASAYLQKPHNFRQLMATVNQVRRTSER